MKKEIIALFLGICFMVSSIVFLVHSLNDRERRLSEKKFKVEKVVRTVRTTVESERPEPTPTKKPSPTREPDATPTPTPRAQVIPNRVDTPVPFPIWEGDPPSIISSPSVK